MEVTDWRGNAYTVGSTVVYPSMSGRSVEIVEATVEDLWMTYQDPETYSWKRLKEGQDPPVTMHSGRIPGTDKDGNRVWGEWSQWQAPAKTELRARLMPTGAGSRNFHRTGVGWRKDEKIKAVVLTVGVNNITAVAAR